MRTWFHITQYIIDIHAVFSDCPVLTLSKWTDNSMPEKYTALHTEIILSCQSGYSFKQEEYNKETSVALHCLPGGKWNVSRIPDCQSKSQSTSLCSFLQFTTWKKWCHGCLFEYCYMQKVVVRLKVKLNLDMKLMNQC
jgi:hypothetical protein